MNNLLTILEELRDNCDNQDSICVYLASRLLNQEERLKAHHKLHTLFKRWRKFSGYLAFPVCTSWHDQGVNKDLLCSLARLEYYSCQDYGENMYSLDTTYGRLRRELLDHLIAQLKEETQTVVILNENKQCVAVTKQDIDHRILKVYWEKSATQELTTDEILAEIIPGDYLTPGGLVAFAKRIEQAVLRKN